MENTTTAHSQPTHRFAYDVAISCAKADSKKAKEINDHFVKEGLRTYYNEHRQHGWYGMSLLQKTRAVFARQSAFAVVLNSSAYRVKDEAGHDETNGFDAKQEWKAILARQNKEKRPYLIEIQTDQVEMEDLKSNFEIHHTEGAQTIKQVAEATTKAIQTLKEEHAIKVGRGPNVVLMALIAVLVVGTLYALPHIEPLNGQGKENGTPIPFPANEFDAYIRKGEIVTVSGAKWAGLGYHCYVNDKALPLAHIIDTKTNVDRLHKLNGLDCVLRFGVALNDKYDWAEITDIQVHVSKYTPLPELNDCENVAPHHEASLLYTEIDDPTKAGTSQFSATHFVKDGAMKSIDTNMFYLKKHEPEPFLLRINAKKPGKYTIYCSLTVQAEGKLTDTMTITQDATFLFAGASEAEE